MIEADPEQDPGGPADYFPVGHGRGPSDTAQGASLSGESCEGPIAVLIGSWSSPLVHAGAVLAGAEEQASSWLVDVDPGDGWPRGRLAWRAVSSNAAWTAPSGNLVYSIEAEIEQIAGRTYTLDFLAGALDASVDPQFVFVCVGDATVAQLSAGVESSGPFVHLPAPVGGGRVGEVVAMSAEFRARSSAPVMVRYEFVLPVRSTCTTRNAGLLVSAPRVRLWPS